MKFLIDPIESHPPHAFALSEIKAFMHLLPTELKRDVKTVKLHNVIKHTAGKWIAEFSRFDQRLVISSRNVDRERAMNAIIRELVRANSCECDAVHRDLPEHVVAARALEILAAVKPKLPPPLHWNRIKLRYAKPRLTDLNDDLLR